MAAKVLVLFYSTYGHIFHMAKAVKEGAEKAGVQVDLKRVPETLPTEILEKMGAVEAQKAFKDVEVISGPDALKEYDAVIFGSPTRFGQMAAQMKQFIDSCGGLWASDALVGKVAGVFTSTATLHGGQETTIRSFHTVLLHLGFLIAGLPYSFKGQTQVDGVGGNSPYGSSCVTGGQGQLMPTETDLEGARYQGEHIAKIAAKLA